MSDLARDSALLLELVGNVDRAARLVLSDTESDLDSDLICWSILEEVNRQLATTRRELANKLAARMADKRRTVTGAGTFERKAARNGTTCTDEDGLWRAVLDTRIVDESTGEVLPQAEVIKRVFGAESKETGSVRLTGASPTKVAAVGIDPDEFFDKGDWSGWTLVLK